MKGKAVSPVVWAHSRSSAHTSACSTQTASPSHPRPMPPPPMSSPSSKPAHSSAPSGANPPSCCSRSSSPSVRPSLPPPLSLEWPRAHLRRPHVVSDAISAVAPAFVSECSQGGAGADNRVVSDAVTVGVMISCLLIVSVPCFTPPSI